MISLIIPCNRAHPWLKKSLASIGQNLSGLEHEVILVLNNIVLCEEDELIQLATDEIPNIIIVKAGTTTLSGALNFGISKAKYEFIARMDSDDLLLPDRILTQYRFLQDNPDIGLVGTHVQTINESGTDIKVVRFPESDREIKSKLRFGNCISHPTVMFRKAAWESAGCYTDAFPLAEDFDLWTRMSRITKIANLPIIGIKYRIHEAQSSHEKSKQQIASTSMIVLENLEKDSKINRNDLNRMMKHPISLGITENERFLRGNLSFSVFKAFRHQLDIRMKSLHLLEVILNQPSLLVEVFKQRIVWRTNGKY